MKKMIKKIAATFMAFALVAAGMLAANKAEVKAANNVKLYFNTTDPTNYGANVWGDGGPVATGGPIVPTWTDKAPGQPSLIVDGEKQGWAYITIDDTSKVVGLQIVKDNSALVNSEDNNNLWNAQIAAQNLTEAYFDVNTGKWYKEAALTNEILPPVLDEIFFVTGDEALTGSNWGATPATGKMTETETDVHTKTFTNVAAGTYGFKVLQDPEDFGWDNVVWNDAYYPGTGENMTITVDALSDVTFKVTVGNTNTLTVTVTPAADEDDDDDTTTPSSPADEDDDDDTTTPSQSSPADEDDDDDTTTPSQSSPADEDDDDDTTTPSQSSPADDDDDDTTPSQSSPADDDDDDTTPSQSSPADDENGNGAGGGTGSGSVDDTPAGDNSMVAIFAILAVLAAAGVVTVVVAKRRAIEE